MKYDFFISYAHEDIDKVTQIVNTLENSGTKCWYAPRDVVGRYAKAIVDAISVSKVFLLCLSTNSAISEHVLNEVEMAYNKRRSANNSLQIEPLCLEQIDIDAPEFDEIMYYIRRINFISPNDTTSPQEIANMVLQKNKNILQLNNEIVYERTTSLYYTSQREDSRLKTQNLLLRKFDEEIYNKIFDEYINPSVLDVGCGNCEMITNRLGNRDCKLVGIERDPNKIEEAKCICSAINASFVVGDIEQYDVWTELEEFMCNNNINGFDIINLSMILLHLKNCCSVLRKLRRLLKPNGCVIIKDIDDGINLAYPDDAGNFARIYDICYKNETSGYRHNGRQIYTDLYNAGFRNITLEKSGFNTIGFSIEEKESMFDIYFKFILGDIQWMHNKYPNNLTISDDCKWYETHYEEILNDFLKDEFMFSLGFLLFVAKK